MESESVTILQSLPKERKYLYAKKTFPALVVTLIVVSVLLAGWTRAERPGTTWEYKIMSVSKPHASYSDVEKEINQLGAEGWELMFNISVNESSIYGPYYFKRPK